jgi:hypothetical protein
MGSNFLAVMIGAALSGIYTALYGRFDAAGIPSTSGTCSARRNRPEPKRVVPGTFSAQAQPGRPPSDAVILFDGTSLAQWQSDNGGDAPWQIINGAMQVVPDSGGIRTRERFGDCQLHIEWAAPAQVESSGQGRGNSGVFLMGRLEIQVLDSYNNSTYADGHAGSYYGVNPPLALPLNPPGEWQVYDIIFRRPVYRDGQLIDPGYVTVRTRLPPLPLGAITPLGWLQRQLRIQADGLSGHLDEFWPDVGQSQWFGGGPKAGSARPTGSMASSRWPGC